ncbi:IclR family transcriptional regulator [Niabella terrae]
MIQVINRAFDIIEFLSRDVNKSYSLSEIADGLKLNRATCANIIKTMMERNYVEQMGPKKGYKLGYMMFKALGSGGTQERLKKAAEEIMIQLTAKIRETSLLSILRNEYRVVIYQVESERSLMVKAPIENLAYYTPSGRIMIAHLEAAALKAFVDSYGLPKKELWPEAATPIKFNKELEKIRRQGYAFHLPPSHVFGMACGIEEKGTVVASLSVYLPAARLTKDSEKQILKELQAAAQKISSRLV